MKQKISITAEDILQGVRGCEISCPVALALTRVFHEADDIRVDELDISVDDVSVKTPVLAAVFVAAFDHGESVEPFEFEIDITP